MAIEHGLPFSTSVIKHELRSIAMPPEPIALSLQPDGNLVIEWSDGQRRRYDPNELRRKCPCATCIYEEASAKRTANPPKKSPISVVQVHPVGNYAYNIQFSDGHATGIFPLEMLWELGEEL
jgi:DUF971 family protein